MRMQDRNKMQNNRKSNQDWVRENRESEDLEEIDLEEINLEEDIWEEDVEDDLEDWREEPEPEEIGEEREYRESKKRARRNRDRKESRIQDRNKRHRSRKENRNGKKAEIGPKNGILWAGVAGAAVLTLTAALFLGKDANESKELAGAQVQALQASETEGIEPEIVLTENQNEELTGVIHKYYEGLAEGDVSMVEGVYPKLSETEKVRIQEVGKYVSEYSDIGIYTLPGFQKNSWIAYVVYQLGFSGYDQKVPGQQSFLVSVGEDGTLKLSQEVESKEEETYLTESSSRDDVVELVNRVKAEYDDLVASDTALAQYITDFQNALNQAAGEAMAAQIEETETTGDGESIDAGTQFAGDYNATATTTVNIRSSDSEKADKVGKAAANDKVYVLEERPNGWSKVQYNGVEGFIKSEYLQKAE